MSMEIIATRRAILIALRAEFLARHAAGDAIQAYADYRAAVAALNGGRK